MRYSIFATLLFAAASLGACQQKPPAVQEPERPPVGKVLPNLPVPPDATPLTTESSKEAMQFLFTTHVSVDSVLSYYRDLLGKEPYRLINESANGGVTSFYVEQDGPSMWVAVQKNGDAGTMVTIAGAAKDASAPKPVPKKP
ncbi:MAG: hypothetical protein V4558_03110 [Gemmatimonadota bacterium]